MHKKLLIVVLLIPFLLIFTLITVRIFSGRNEDTWLCVDGKWEKHGNPDTPMPRTGCGDQPGSAGRDPLADRGPVNRPDFRQTGNITNFDAETESSTVDWFFVYERPGEPANRVRLVFDENSRCRMISSTAECDITLLQNGSRVRLTGSTLEDMNNDVLVINLIVMSENER